MINRPNTSTSTAITIEKEKIAELSFPKDEVLKELLDQNERKSRIEKGMMLGNGQKRKVKIIFEDEEGLKNVETTIWGVTEKNIILKGEIIIPIHRIHEVKFY